MDILAIVAELAQSGALDRAAEQTGADPFQIGHAVFGALQEAYGDRPINAILATSMANAGISPSLANSVRSALAPLIAHHFAPSSRAELTKRGPHATLRNAAPRLIGGLAGLAA